MTVALKASTTMPITRPPHSGAQDPEPAATETQPITRCVQPPAVKPGVSGGPRRVTDSTLVVEGRHEPVGNLETAEDRQHDVGEHDEPGRGCGQRRDLLQLCSGHIPFILSVADGRCYRLGQGLAGPT